MNCYCSVLRGQDLVVSDLYRISHNLWFRFYSSARNVGKHCIGQSQSTLLAGTTCTSALSATRGVLNLSDPRGGQFF